VVELRDEVARLRAEKGRVKTLKSQLERSAAFLQEQKAAFLKTQASAGSNPSGSCGHLRMAGAMSQGLGLG
jgi:hypothetical protein